MLTGSEIRETFLRFFASKGHRARPLQLAGARPTIPRCSSPTRGMNQFKDVFLGLEKA